MEYGGNYEFDYDVVIIGVGVTGCAVARELSRYQARVCVMEKEEDVCCGTSKANSGIVHAGYDAWPGSVKAKMNLRGNALMEPLSKELDFPFFRIGSMVLCLREEDRPKLQELYDRGIANGVPDLQILSAEKAKEMEANVSDEVCGALYAPTGGIVCPFELNIALAENAYMNGVEFKFHTEVQNIEKIAERNLEGNEKSEKTVKSEKIVKSEKSGETGRGFRIYTCRGVYTARYVVNAAGVYADVIHNMVSGQKIHITPGRGEYCLLDKSAGNHVSRIIFALPGRQGKGVLVTPTVHGNLLMGPTAEYIENKEGTNTTREGLDQVLEKSAASVKNLPMRQVITSFAGLRAHEDGNDFIIGEVEDAPGFIDCAGIESPGLTSCPAIGEYVAEMLREKMDLKEKEEFNPIRKGILNPADLPKEERAAWIKKHPSYGNIICRCEMVTEGEIVDAIRRPLGAKSLDGVKRRTRAGMGRCQSGFCSPRVMEILARELQMDIRDITKSGGASKIVAGVNKEAFENEKI